MIQMIKCSTVDEGETMEFLLGLGAGVWLGASLGVIVASILRTSKDDGQVTWPAKYSRSAPYEIAESAMRDGTGSAAPLQ
jgi:hypothetical protein